MAFWFLAPLSIPSANTVLHHGAAAVKAPPGSATSALYATLDSNFQRDWSTDFKPLQPGIQPPAQTVSVIFAAHGEHQYIERTMASLYENTPREISEEGSVSFGLLEVILIDDASEPPLLPLVRDKYPEIIVRRHETQQGLIRSKTHGASIASGDIIVFLDAHVKTEPGWLPPLLRRISENYKKVVVPLIPILDGESWTVKEKGVGIKMMFSWGLQFNWFEDGNDDVPIMSGGLLAMSRRWWFESGEYDTGMRLWGAENIEQSIRIWLCGGEIQVARDSFVSHVFRPHFPYKIDDSQVMINKARTVEAWFDDWKERVYNGDPNLRHFIHRTGDISSRLKLKEDLKCKPFSFFVERFKPIFQRRGMLDDNLFVIKDSKSGECVQMVGKEWHLGQCDKRSIQQRFSGEGGALRIGPDCVDSNSALQEKLNQPILVFHCQDYIQGLSASQTWSVEDGKLLWGGGLCAAVDFGDRVLKFRGCDDAVTQHSFEKDSVK